MSKKILIVGGSGFVSGTLARVAMQAGHEVWTITRGQKSVLKGARSIIADRKESNVFKKAVDNCNIHWDMIVDCICYVPSDMKQNIDVFQGKTDLFVFISTDFVFDPAKRVFPQSDESDFYTNKGYGGDKRLCELELINSKKNKTNWVIFRPCHIYGPGSELGCLPMHGRDPELITKIKDKITLNLVGGGYFLQQPIFAEDLAKLILSAHGKHASYGQIFQSAGPDIIESKKYYEIVAEHLNVEININEISVKDSLQSNPDLAPFFCHRIYDLSKIVRYGLQKPSTSIKDGLIKHTNWLLSKTT